MARSILCPALLAVVLWAGCETAADDTGEGWDQVETTFEDVAAEVPDVPGDDVPGGDVIDTAPDVATDDAALEVPDVPGDGGDEADGPSEVEADVEAEAEADAVLLPLRDDGLLPEWSWEEQARRAIDHWTLPDVFSGSGYALPAGSEVYAARVIDGAGGPAYVLYEAGGGAFSQEFWPASTVKVLAAVGALDFVRTLGFTGAAHVVFDSGFEDDLSAIYDRAIRVSSNIDYDRCVRIAGFDRFNELVLSAGNGFPTTVIQRSYSGVGVRTCPGITLTEGSRADYVAERTSTASYGCPSDGNCANLFELTEAVRRLVLDAELTAGERFPFAAADLAGLNDALCNATPSFFAPGVARALGHDGRICHKPGWVPWNDYLDHGVVEDPVTGERWLLAAAVPDLDGSGGVSADLEDIAEQVLGGLRGVPGGMPLQPAGGIPLVVQLDDRGPDGGRRAYTLTVDAPGADRLELFTDGWFIGSAAGSGPRFTVDYSYSGGGERLLAVAAYAGAAMVGYRSLRVYITPP
jgi:hypothetical protein